MSRSVETRFKPGQSGNPKGRPKGFPAFREMCQGSADDAFARLKAELKVDGATGVKAAETILAYAWGKPTQVVEVDANVNVSVPQLLEEARRRLKPTE